MKIAFLLSYMRAGGSERVIANLSNEFVRRGNEVSVLMLSESDEYSHYPVGPGVRLIPVQKDFRPKDFVKGILTLKTFFTLRRHIRKIKPDILISFLPNVHVYAYLANRGFRIPHVVSERNDPTKHPKGKMIRILRNYMFKKADGCVFQTADARKFYPPQVRDRSVIIPNPVVLMYEPTESLERERKITAVGRLEPQKNYPMLLCAFAAFSEKMPGYKLVICGEGSLRGEIERLTCELGLEESVVFMGQVGNPHEIIFNSTAFALSSDHEGMPNALLEAMALGVPSVSTDCPCGGPSELIRDGENGILVPVGDVNAMAEAFERIAENAEFAGTLSANARKLRQIYSVRNIAERWLEYFENVIGRRK